MEAICGSSFGSFALGEALCFDNGISLVAFLQSDKSRKNS